MAKNIKIQTTVMSHIAFAFGAIAAFGAISLATPSTAFSQYDDEPASLVLQPGRIVSGAVFALGGAQAGMAADSHLVESRLRKGTRHLENNFSSKTGLTPKASTAMLSRVAEGDVISIEYAVKNLDELEDAAAMLSKTSSDWARVIGKLEAQRGVMLMDDFYDKVEFSNIEKRLADARARYSVMNNELQAAKANIAQAKAPGGKVPSSLTIRRDLYVDKETKSALEAFIKSHPASRPTRVDVGTTYFANSGRVKSAALKSKALAAGAVVLFATALEEFAYGYVANTVEEKAQSLTYRPEPKRRSAAGTAQ